MYFYYNVFIVTNKNVSINKDFNKMKYCKALSGIYG